jgi:N-acetylmuramoyl-L-alanine amidase
MRNIKYIVIHCTAGHKNQSVESIKSWWKQLGWKNVGYHFLVMGDGSVERLADLDKVTNGVAGYNSNSIHISYTGGMVKDDRTDAQKASILLCIKEALEYAVKGGTVPKILGHRDFGVNKACPQFDAIKEYGWITFGSEVS